VLRVGSLCSGYGGLDEAVCQALGGQVAWVADNDPSASAVLAARYPGVPNLGDIGQVRWESVEGVDVVIGGFPCQDVSAAGLRAGLHPGNRSGAWLYMAEAIRVLRPALVVIENVKGLLSARASGNSGVEPCEVCMGDSSGRVLRALGAVLGDLSALGFDAEWETVSAADAGCCHLRERVFILAWPAADSAGS
jgi:DNA (cytosine-5)-methyltransferase 1